MTEELMLDITTGKERIVIFRKRRTIKQLPGIVFGLSKFDSIYIFPKNNPNKVFWTLGFKSYLNDGYVAIYIDNRLLKYINAYGHEKLYIKRLFEDDNALYQMFMKIPIDIQRKILKGELMSQT